MRHKKKTTTWQTELPLNSSLRNCSAASISGFCWRTDQAPRRRLQTDLMTAGLIGFCQSENIREEWCSGPEGLIQISPSHQHLQQLWIYDYKWWEVALVLSPGLDGQRKCWYKLWSWRPKPSRSCQMSWEEQRRGHFTCFHGVSWPALFILALRSGNFVWKTASAHDAFAHWEWKHGKEDTLVLTR